MSATSAALGTSRPRVVSATFLFACASGLGAALVFIVEPLIAKMLLPSLGGAPAVWNTALAFFQVMLLAGYLYAHLLQRILGVRRQIVMHLTALVVAGLSLPLTLSSALGDPKPDAPVSWLLGVLVLSIGAPFALLSATAPLVQSWYAARLDPADGKADAYPLYAASNIGSLVGLLAYPLAIEPFSTLTAQRYAWSIGFAIFVLAIVALGLTQRFGVASGRVVSHAPVTSPRAGAIVRWILLAAAPSSLMLGVTNYITTDVASFPFLWVVPLAAYLVTFILAFRARALEACDKNMDAMVAAQAFAVILCLVLAPVLRLGFAWQLAINLVAFFLTALLCHRQLANTRPDPAHLTIFYLCISFGGVVGGSFNAFVAPAVFSSILEYPLVLILACLARPWGAGVLQPRQRWLAGAAIVAAAAPLIATWIGVDGAAFAALRLPLLVVFSAAALQVDRAPWFVAALGVAWLSVTGVAEPYRAAERSFFGVLRVTEMDDPVLGPVRIQYHGTTLHGVQSLSPATACQPLVYYAPQTPLGQAVTQLQRQKPGLEAAFIGLGTGALASYVRASDRATFYEIDPLVVREAKDPALFSYVDRCARAPVGIVLGDARLTIRHVPDGTLDLLVVDAFSSDTVPAHLLTVEALRTYFSKLKPDGVLLMNLTNRHFELRGIVAAGLQDIGASALTQRSKADSDSVLVAAPTTGLVASRSGDSLAAFRADGRWSPVDMAGARPWTDDYSNLLSAIVAKSR